MNRLNLMKCVWMLLVLSWVASCGGRTGRGGSDGGTSGCTFCEPWEQCIAASCVFNESSQWNVVALEGTVSSMKPGGGAWDPFGGAPDPYVCITINGLRKCTTTAPDTFHAQWNEVLFIGVGGGSLLGGFRIEYYDEDATTPDAVCAPSNVTVRADDFNNGRATFVCGDTGTIVIGLTYRP